MQHCGAGRTDRQSHLRARRGRCVLAQMTWVEPTGERLAANVVHFARLLRRAGLRVGPGDTLDAQRAVAAVDIVSRDEFYWALHAVLVRRHADHALFDEAFRLFWRDPMGVHSALSLLLQIGRAHV